MGSGMHANYSHLSVFFLHNSGQSEATFVLLSHQCFIPVLPQNGSLSLRRSCPQNELVWEKSSSSVLGDCARVASFCMWQLSSGDEDAHLHINMLGLEEMPVNGVVRVGPL